jgi:hypothetical protein
MTFSTRRRRTVLAACVATVSPFAASAAAAARANEGVGSATNAAPSSHVVRIWGGTAVGTAIAASQYSYDPYATASGHRKADAVVLARSDAYYDSLAGATLAAQKQAPLLLTPPARLDPAVAAEIKRVLEPGGTVYVLGGPEALSPTVASQVAALGYTVDRLAGGDMYGTAIAIDKAITANPARIVIATGASYYDALSSATFAATPGTVMVLTDNATIPPVSLSYIQDSLSGKTVSNAPVAEVVGGPAYAAVDQVYENGTGFHFGFDYYVGANAEDTALQVADIYGLSKGPASIGIATDRGWYDALAGGAMIGHDGGILLLTDPTGLYAPDAQFIAKDVQYVGETTPDPVFEADVFGGPAALPDSLIAPLGTALANSNGNANGWDYTSFTPGSPVPAFAP